MASKRELQIQGKLERFSVGDADRRRLPEAELRHLLFHLYLIRRFEERLLGLKDQNLVHGPVHSSMGQEGVAVGAMQALQVEDVVASTHRGHHHFLAKVLNARAGRDYDPLAAVPAAVQEVVDRSFAEILGLAGGWCRGRGGSMHLGDRASGCLGTNAIVTGGVPAATGAAWALGLRGKGGLGVAFLGDGAMNQGVLHEVMNMAALWKIPIIYFIENNLYAVATHVRESCAVEHLAQAGLAHAVPAWVIDGMDPIACCQAVAAARRLGGPVVIEAKTYRYKHQAQGLPGSAFGYRSKKEEDEWLARDPFLTYAAKLIELGVLNEKQRAALLAAAADIVDKGVASVTRAGAAPGSLVVPESLYPGRAELLVGVRSAGGELKSLNFREPADFPIMKKRSLIEVIPEVMLRRFETDPMAMLLGEEVGHMKGGAFMASKGLFLKHRERVIDTPISEAGFSGMALGLALMGRKPIIEIMYPDFALVAADQLFNQIGKCRYMYGDQHDIPLVARTRVGIGSGYGAQHSMEPAALYALFPGWRIVAPSTPFDYIGLFNTAFASNDPVLVIEHQALYPSEGLVPEDRDFCIPFGRARVTRPGESLTIVSYSRMSLLALEAADLLDQEGIPAELIDLRSVDYAGIDWEAIGRSLEKTGRLLIAEEGLLPGGIGAQISDEVQRRFFDFLDGEIVRVGGEAVPMPVSNALERMAVPGAGEIAAAARRMARQ